MLHPRIELLSAKKLIGKHLPMTFAENRTQELWESFMPVRNTISNRVCEDLISLQIYPQEIDFSTFSIHTPFEKWAAVEVTEIEIIPEGMGAFSLDAGQYVVFDYVGNPAEARKFFEYIFGHWLPQSSFQMDNRPHFEILGSRYQSNDPTSEEEIYIPVRKKELISS